MMNKAVNVKKKEIVMANTLEVIVGTNCPQGGDAGHGGVTILRLTNLGGTAMKGIVIEDSYGDTQEIHMEFYGDHEAYSLLEALKFAVKELENKL